MLEVTGEMVAALWRQLPSEVQDGREPDDIRGWVAYVLAIVERDNQVRPLCCEELMPRLRCTRVLLGEPHRGDHEGKTSTGSTVRWS